MPRRRGPPSSAAPSKKKRLLVEPKAGTEASVASDADASLADDCAICYESFNFKTTLPACGHSFCFLCIKGVALRGGVCPLCRKPIRRGLFDKPNFEDPKDEPACSSQADNPNSAAEDKEKSEGDAVQWFYESRGGGWWRFEPRQEGDIEEGFASGKSALELMIAGYPYVLDFQDMAQYRKDLPRSPRWERKLKRVAGKDAVEKMNSPVRGVAGLLANVGKKKRSS